MTEQTEEIATEEIGLAIESVAIDSLVPDPDNVRTHPQRNMEAITASLRQFGQMKPIVIDAAGLIVAGNGTYEAAKALGWTQLDAVRTTLTGAELKAYAIADNKSADLAGWDFEALAGVLDEIKLFDEGLLESTGFAEFELDAMLTPESLGSSESDDQPQDDKLSGGSEKRTEHHTVAFSVEQWEIIEQAVAKVRTINDDQTIGGARALELIAADWLAGAPQTESLT